MRATRVIGLVLAAVLGATVAVLLDSRRGPNRVIEGYSQDKPEVSVPSRVSESEETFKTNVTHPLVKAAAPVAPPTQTSKLAPQHSTNQPAPVFLVAQPSTVKAPILDPAARRALRLVGADPEAEAYWLSAINNPEIPAEERKDLIEDLNEDGLSDPKNPSPDDMPLIWSRIELIEEIAPDAMDEVNAAAFAEAYKDLMHLAYGIPPD